MKDPGSFQWCPVTGPEAAGTNWNVGDFSWASGNIFSLWSSPSTGTGNPERWWSLPPWDLQKPSGHGPRQLALGGPAWGRQLDKMTSRGPSQPQPVCDSAWFFCNVHILVWSTCWMSSQGKNSIETILDIWCCKYISEEKLLSLK